MTNRGNLKNQAAAIADHLQVARLIVHPKRHENQLSTSVSAFARPIRQIRGLDGLRAVAVLMVMAHHCGWGWAQGGWLGVEVFFVISGYLITKQLLRPGWGLAEFMWRRVARLWPALMVLCAFMAALAAASSSSFTAVLAAACYAYTPVMLTPLAATDNYAAHTWSLAVEMQFYIGWAVFMLSARHWSRSLLTASCIGLAVTSYGAQLLLVLTGHAHEAYFASPMRLDGLFVGAALAAYPGRIRIPRLVTWALLVVAIAAMPLADAVTGIGLSLFSPLVILLTFSLVSQLVDKDRGALATFLDVSALRWIGVRSYSLYLWHWPMFALAGEHVSGGATLTTIAKWALSMAAASMSYSMVEVPARRWLTSRRIGRA